MNYILFDDETRLSLLPFTFTRPVCEIRIGILTIREKWEKHLNQSISFFTENYLREKFPLKVEEDNILINGSVLPDEKLLKEIQSLKAGEKISSSGSLLAWRIKSEELKEISSFQNIEMGNPKNYSPPVFKINFSWEIFSKNKQAMHDDFFLLTKGRKSQPVSSTNQIINPENIFLEEGARVECATLNASDGIIYIGKDAEVMEGAMIRGSFALCEHSQVRMGAKIYSATTIGPNCRVAGEITNSVLYGHSNKAHDGFLGDSVIGEWCNLGAGTNNSNLKNNYSQVKMWNFKEETYLKTGLNFCGLMMGDHSKCSINTMFNTGTVVGVSANIFGSGFPPKFIPSFSWGGSEGFKTYRIEEAIEVAQRVFERRTKEFDATEIKIMKHLFDFATNHRAW
jgi:UDP-N-acetylglucosamine diphosphorylase/glucosamine-1-phosphate N-acetyltransferase